VDLEFRNLLSVSISRQQQEYIFQRKILQSPTTISSQEQEKDSTVNF